MAKNTGGEEMADLQSEPAAPKQMDLVGGLVFVTFLALIVGIFLSQKILGSYFNAGMFGGH
jgi:hypothetical protein